MTPVEYKNSFDDRTLQQSLYGLFMVSKVAMLVFVRDDDLMLSRSRPAQRLPASHGLAVARDLQHAMRTSNKAIICLMSYYSLLSGRVLAPDTQ